MFKSLGFTLIELIITCAVLSIIACFALPYYHQLMASLEFKNTPRLLTIYIQKAKYDAFTHHTNVVICPSQDLYLCNHDWDNQIISFLDKNQNLQRDSNELLLNSTEFHHKYGTLTWSGFRHDYLVFQGNTGLPRDSNGTFSYCSFDQPQYVQLILSKMGHTRLEHPVNC